MDDITTDEDPNDVLTDPALNSMDFSEFTTKYGVTWGAEQYMNLVIKIPGLLQDETTVNEGDDDDPDELLLESYPALVVDTVVDTVH